MIARPPLSANSVTLHGGVAGHLLMPRGDMIAGAAGVVRIPVPFFLVEHPDGLAMVDCGLSPLLLDPQLPYRVELLAAGIEVEMTDDQTAAARLKEYGIDLASIASVILSHCHYDHAGGLSQFPGRELLVQRSEWTFAQQMSSGDSFLYKREFFDVGSPLRLLDGEHDPFGDGCVLCLPTPGHTPGHQSVLVHSRHGSFLIAADACYFCDTLRTRRLPPESNVGQMNSSLDLIQSLAAEGVTVLAGHEPQQWSVPYLHAISPQNLLRKDFSC